MGLAGCAPQVSAEGNAKAADTGAATSWRDKPEMPTEFIETVDADIVSPRTGEMENSPARASCRGRGRRRAQISGASIGKAGDAH